MVALVMLLHGPATVASVSSECEIPIPRAATIGCPNNLRGGEGACGTGP
jgi:hypothetical protein